MLLILDADPGFTDRERRVLVHLDAVLDAGPVVVHHSAAEVPRADAARAGAGAVSALREAERILDLRAGGPVHVFLYRDAADLAACTGAAPEVEAFAGGGRCIHQPVGFAGSHEMAHVLAREIPRGEGTPAPDPFLEEGLATAVAGPDLGVALEDWAAVYLRVGILPRLAALRDRWPRGPARGLHHYHVAGAFVRFLLDRKGPAAVKEWYARGGRPGPDGGDDLGALEGEWLERLRARDVPAAAEDRVRRWLGMPAGSLPAALAGAAGEKVFDGASLDGWEERRAGTWRAADGLLRGEAGREWGILRSVRDFPAGSAVRVRFRTTGDAVLQVRVHGVPGSSDDALLGPTGTFLTLQGGEEGIAGGVACVVPGRWTEAILASEGATGRLYLDGRLVLEAPGGFAPARGTVALGVRGGVVEVAEVSILAPAARQGS